MSKHTKGPWEACFIVDQGWSIIGPNRELIAVLGEDTIECDDNIEDDARRIVACVNACAAFEDEELQYLSAAGQFGHGVIANLRDQRDALLAALEKLEDRGFFNESSCADAETNADMAEIRAAIAAAKGGAV